MTGSEPTLAARRARGRARLTTIVAVAALGAAGLVACQPASLTVPAGIARDCSRDVTDDLNHWMESMPNGSTIQFGGGCFRIDQTLVLENRHHLDVDGQGATFETDDPTGDGSTLASPSKAARTRDHWRLIGGSDIHLHDMIIRGANANAGTSPEAYVAALEAQHGVDVQGTVDVELDHLTIAMVYGDFVYFGKHGSTFSSGRLHDSTLTHNGRQGVSLTAVDTVSIDHNFISDTRRSTFDIEPNGQDWGVEHVAIGDNTIGPGRLLFVAGGGQGPVGWVSIVGNQLQGRPMTMQISSDETTRRHDIWVIGNVADTGWGTTGPAAAMVFANVDTVWVDGNEQPLQAGRGDSGVRATGSTGVKVEQNVFLNAVDVMEHDVVGQTVCSNRIMAGGAFDQPTVCPK